MTIPIKPRLLSRQLDQLSTPATLKQFTAGVADTYGDEIPVATSTPVNVIKSVVTNTRLPFVRRGELGNYYVMQVEFFLDDTVIPANTSVDRPLVLVHLGLEYEITEIDDSKIGVIRLIGYRERK